MILSDNSSSLSNKIRKSILILLLLGSSISIIFAQRTREEPPPVRERLFFGGNLGLQFGTVTDIQVSPVIGLWVLPRLSVAVGPDFRYYKNKYYTFPYDRTNIYGAKAYMQLVVLKNINSVIPIGSNTSIVLHIEDEILSLESSFWKDPTLTNRFYLNTVLAGGGLSQQIGQRSALDFIILWALNDSQYGVYTNPEIRVSFNF